MMEPVTFGIGLILLIGLALAFDFMNGFHDAANSIATVVSTRVLRPYQAVILAAFFNIAAIAIFHLSVATTVGKGIVSASIIDYPIIFGALIGAVLWNIITWRLGIPSSSSHALIGGLIGAALAKAGTAPLIVAGILKVVVFIVVSPLLGFVFGSAFIIGLSWLLRRIPPRRIDVWFRRLQLISASLYSLGHGGNDAQKTMGIIWMLLVAAGAASASTLPTWVIIACYTMIGLGTALGGWRIVKTMGQKITKLKPVSGFCAETGGAIALFIATAFGIPVSTTHTITGAIVGVGAARGFSAVRWGVARRIVWAWVLTIPCSALMAALAWYGAELFI